jgi:hypothetical protein
MYQTIVKFLRGFLLAIGLGAVLSACGGGSGEGGSGNATLNQAKAAITGTAATGGPFNGTIRLISANGAERTAATDAGGIFIIDLSGLNGPFLLQTGSGTQRMFSWAPAAGVANITPLTTLLLELAVIGNLLDLSADWPTKHTIVTETEITRLLAVINTNLKDRFSAAGLNPHLYNFLTTPFVADGTGIDQLLDQIHIDFDFVSRSFTLRDPAGTPIFFDQNIRTGEGGTIGPASVTVSRSTLPHGNGSMNPIQVTVTDGTGDQAGSPEAITRVGVTAAVNGVKAALDISYATATGEVKNVVLSWMEISGPRFTQCGTGTSCSGASVDRKVHLITLSEVILTSRSNHDSATVNGTIKFTPLPDT